MYIIQANSASTTMNNPVVNKAKTLAANIAAAAFSVGNAIVESGFKIKSSDIIQPTVETETVSNKNARQSHNTRYQRASAPETDRSDFGQKIKDALDTKSA
jgi:hypothetical protein